MPIIPYESPRVSPEASLVLESISEYSLRAKSMLTALGDYWTHYYRNLEPISSAATGYVASYSKEYTRFLDMVMSANILDVPLRQTEQFSLLVIRQNNFTPVYDANGNIDYFFVEIPEVVDTAWLCTALFESRVCLEKGKHYDIELRKGIKFYVDLFEDKQINNFAYEMGDFQDRAILLWAMDVSFTSTIIYERYGRFLYKKAIDSEQYKWLVSALMRFYESAKSVKSIQDVLNILYGVPYTRYKDEKIVDVYYVDKALNRTLEEIEDPYVCIETDRANYYTYAFSDVLFKPGDVVPQFSLLANFNKVEDYVTKPKWWEDCAFPYELFAGADTLSADQKNELMDKVLKYNTVHISLGVSFETWKTYLAQVKELFSIIESGFPVYLYPLVDTFFKAVFLDKWNFRDEFELIRLEMGITTFWDWGNYLRFDGSSQYYNDPCCDHGSKAKPGEYVYNAELNYSGENKHEGPELPALHYDGNVAYNSCSRKNFDGDREELLINKVLYKQSDTFILSEARHTAPLCYTGFGNFKGDLVFGQSVEWFDNDPMRCRVLSNLTDKAKSPTDRFSKIQSRAKLIDTLWPIFNGVLNYAGLRALNSNEEFTMRISRA